MDHLSISEAKAQFSKLLDRVAAGESVMIERHGVPVAVLRPVDAAPSAPVDEVIAQLKRFRAQNRLEGLSIREMTAEGRR